MAAGKPAGGCRPSRDRRAHRSHVSAHGALTTLGISAHVTPGRPGKRCEGGCAHPAGPRCATVHPRLLTSRGSKSSRLIAERITFAGAESPPTDCPALVLVSQRKPHPGPTNNERRPARLSGAGRLSFPLRLIGWLLVIVADRIMRVTSGPGGAGWWVAGGTSRLQDDSKMISSGCWCTDSHSVPIQRPYKEQAI